MVIAVGLSCYNIALFHLINHAFYKGLLFLGAGSVIHAVADNQDFRRYGGLRSFLPLTYSVMLIASLSLVAFPFMTGFYSKDFILESAYGQFNFSSTVVYIIATIGAMFTTLYSIKVLYLTFLTNPNGPIVNYKQAHEGDIFMSLPLIILAIFSIFFGYITKDIFIGLGSGFFGDNALFIHPSHEIMLDTEFGTPVIFKLLPLVFTLLLSIISIILSEYLSSLLIYFKLSRIGYNIFSFFNQRFLIELFYNKYITNFILKLGGQTTKVLDKGSVEFLGPYGLEKGLLNLSTNITKLDSGIITSYALYILIALVFYVLLYTYVDGSISLLLLLISLIFTINICVTYNMYSYKDMQIIESKFVFGCPWAVPQLFTDYLRILKDRSSPGLEWALDNPPKPHAFTSLPLQSMPYTPAIHRYKLTGIDYHGNPVEIWGENTQRLIHLANRMNCSDVRIVDTIYPPQTEIRNSNVQTQNSTVSTSNTDNTPAVGSTSNTDNTPGAGSTSNTGNNMAGVNTSNTGNNTAGVNTSNTGSANNDFTENIIPVCFPITTVVINLYIYIKLHSTYSSYLDIFEHRVLGSLNKFYFKLKNFFFINILFYYI